MDTKKKSYLLNCLDAASSPFQIKKAHKKTGLLKVEPWIIIALTFVVSMAFTQ